MKKKKENDISGEQHSKQANIRQGVVGGGRLWKATQKV